MKEIGEAFREARSEIGISKEEVIKDLGVTESQLDNLEDGNVNAFKDIFFLKDIVRKYAKYLNLDEDEIVDKFNDFIFGYTSRIPINDILEQTREINILELKNKENKIVSPYTNPTKNNDKNKQILIYGVTIFILLILVFLIIKFIINKEENKFISDFKIEYNGGMI